VTCNRELSFRNADARAKPRCQVRPARHGATRGMRLAVCRSTEVEHEEGRKNEVVQPITQRTFRDECGTLCILLRPHTSRGAAVTVLSFRHQPIISVTRKRVVGISLSAFVRQAFTIFDVGPLFGHKEGALPPFSPERRPDAKCKQG
jgi:hypothetical protein